MISELDVVNACLATIGEMPLVELEEDHPLIAAARQNFKEAMFSEMALKWWFNTDFLTLKQANDKFIYVPQDALACVPLDREDLTMRGRRLYNRYSGSYEISGSVDVYVIRNVVFEDLPVPAQLLVRDRAVLSFQKNYDADDSRTTQLEQSYRRSYMTLNAENYRQANLNMFSLQQVNSARARAGYRSGRPRRNLRGIG